jgi:hypothetical protein
MKKEFWHYMEIAQENNKSLIKTILNSENSKKTLLDIKSDQKNPEDQLKLPSDQIFKKWYHQINGADAETIGNNWEKAWENIKKNNLLNDWEKLCK